MTHRIRGHSFELSEPRKLVPNEDVIDDDTRDAVKKQGGAEILVHQDPLDLELTETAGQLKNNRTK